MRLCFDKVLMNSTGHERNSVCQSEPVEDLQTLLV